MPLSHCRYVAVQKYTRWIWYKNPFAKLTLILADKMHLWIFKMYYTLFNGFLQLLNANCLPPRFIFYQVDGQFLRELYLLIRCDTINLTLQLIHNPVCISDMSDGGFSLSVGLMDLKINTLVGDHVCCSINIFSCSSFHLSKFRI